MIGLKLWFVFLVLLNYDLICRHLIYVYNFSGTCPLHKARGAPFWHVDLFLLPLGMCSILYFEKYSASNLPLSMFSVAILKNDCGAYFWNGKNYLVEFPLYQIAYRNQGGVDFHTSHLAVFWVIGVCFLEVWASLNSVRELDRIEALKAPGPGEVRSWSGSLCFLGEPVSVFRSGLDHDGPESDGYGDSGSLLGDYLWQCFPNSHLFNSNWGFVKTVSRDPPPGILIQEVRVGPVNLHF